MEEKFLYHVWKFKLFNSLDLKTTTGESIEIIKPGNIQHDSGPDFFNAKVKIGDTLWAGNIEIDINTSDWKKHKHENNQAYNKIILHVVYEVDKINDNKIPVLELKSFISENVIAGYKKLISNNESIPCASDLPGVDEIIVSAWLERLLMERLENKVTEIEAVLKQNKNNWEETFYLQLAKNFGFKTNAVPFELLAKATPLKVLAKHKNDLMQLEAILFGQAGMLQEKIDDKYHQQLQKEYHHLKNKFALTSVDKSLWKFLRLRPVNFPTIRIAQFASLIHESSHLFSKIIEVKNVKDFDKLFQADVSHYWKTHYTFGKESGKKTKHIGDSSIQLMVINTVVPFLFLYGKWQKSNSTISRAIQLLEKLPAEKNHITASFSEAGIILKNAAQTQSLIQLSQNYCTRKRCLDCAIGLKILNRKL